MLFIFKVLFLYICKCSTASPPVDGSVVTFPRQLAVHELFVFTQ